MLESISRTFNGCATIADLSSTTGLHRTTVYRLLETLIRDGYVRRSPSDDSYRLNLRVRSLSDGFTDDEWISEIANPVLGELLQKTVWPSDLCTIDGDCMLVRETTHRFSPLSFHRSMIRQRLPLLCTAAGRAYLAFCGEEERYSLLGLLAAGDDVQSRMAKDTTFIDNMLRKIRRNGYATNDGEWQDQAKVAAMGMPIRHKDGVIGSINLVYLRKAISMNDAVARYLPPMQEAVARIEAQLTASAAPVRNAEGDKPNKPPSRRRTRQPE